MRIVVVELAVSIEQTQKHFKLQSREPLIFSSETSNFLARKFLCVPAAVFLGPKLIAFRVYHEFFYPQVWGIRISSEISTHFCKKRKKNVILESIMMNFHLP